MVQLYGVFCAFASLTVIQPIHEVDSVPIAAAIGVVSGVMGIIEFLRARYIDLVALKQMNMIESMVEEESSEWQTRLNWNFENIQSAIKNLEGRQELSKRMDSMRESFRLIHNNYKSILQKRRSLEEESSVSPSLRDLYELHAQGILTQFSINSPLRTIYDTISDSFKNYSIYQQPLIDQYEDYLNVCVTNVSPLQAVTRLLEHIVWTSSYYYSTMMMSHEILEKLGKRDTDPNPAVTHTKEISGWYNETIKDIGPKLRKVSRELYVCGLPNLSNKRSFHELKVFKKFFLQKCDGIHSQLGCSSINETRSCEARNERDVCSWSRPCGGKMFNCTDSNDLDLCVSDAANDQRYQYYHKSGVDGKFNDYGRCQTQKLREMRWLETGFRLPGYVKIWAYFCGSCECTCQEEKYQINQASAYADVNNDMVVTGAKFVLKDNILEIHIQQGKLLPNGNIEIPPEGPESLPWIGPQKQDLKPISWEGLRKILIAKHALPLYGRAVSGLGLKCTQFRRNSNEEVIQLRVETVQIHFMWGKVVNPGHFEREPELLPKRVLNLTNAESPRRLSDFSREITQKDVRLELTTSGGKDGGQSTIPFIDAREVTSAIPTPMSGAELYWRGREGTGGFIGISLYTYDHIPYVPRKR